jgi:hypothetical protein
LYILISMFLDSKQSFGRLISEYMDSCTGRRSCSNSMLWEPQNQQGLILNFRSICLYYTHSKTRKYDYFHRNPSRLFCL